MKQEQVRLAVQQAEREEAPTRGAFIVWAVSSARPASTC